MPRKATGNPTGRPPYEPTDDDRKAVGIMTASGLNQTQVARQLGNGGISENTLVKYFREELDTAVDKANTKMAATAFNKGLSGDAQMIRYWLNCRAGWKETSVQEHTGKDGAPLSILQILKADDASKPD